MYFPEGFKALKADFGRTIRSVRKSRRIKQQTLADDLGISRETLSRIENGHEPRMAVLLNLLDALEIEWDQVLETGSGRHLVFQDGPRGDAARNIGKQLRARRRALGLSLAQAAISTGLSASTLSRLERGQSRRSKAFAEDAVFSDRDVDDRPLLITHQGLRDFLAK